MSDAFAWIGIGAMGGWIIRDFLGWANEIINVEVIRTQRELIEEQDKTVRKLAGRLGIKLPNGGE